MVKTPIHPSMQKFIERIGGTQALDSIAGPYEKFVHHLTASRPVKDALSGTWLGHPLHPALTDLPIGAWAMATTVDLTTGRAGAPASQRLVALGVLAALPTAAAGASDWSDTYGPDQRVGLMHAAANATATVSQVFSWLARRRGHRLSGVALSIAGLGLCAGSAYLGGHLVLVRGIGVNNTAFQEPVTDWTEVADLTTLSADKPVRVKAGDVPVVLVLHDGTVHALSATCSHAGGPLDEGRVDADACIRCPWHGSEFRLTDGTVHRAPASVAQPHWDIDVTGGKISIRLPTP